MINLTPQAKELVAKYCDELSMASDDFINHCIIDYSIPVSSNFVYCQHCGKALWIKSLHPQSHGTDKILCRHCTHVQNYDFDRERWIGSNQHRIDIGNRIKELRESKSWNQSDLADRAGLTQQSISKIEKGSFSPGVDILNKIAEALNCKIEIS